MSFTNLQIWKKRCEKEMGIVQTVKKVQTIQKVIFVRKKKIIEHNIIPKIKTYSPSIKIGLPETRTFKSSL